MEVIADVRVVRPLKDLGPNRHLLARRGEDGAFEPVLISGATRESRTTRGRVKVAFGAIIDLPQDQQAFGVFAEFRLEMN